MFDEIATHVLNHSAPQRTIALSADPADRTSIYNATTV
jgi:hypothetical protein